MLSAKAFLAVLSVLPLSVLSTKIVLTNDDGWAVANIRAVDTDLRAAGYQVILSAPAENQSGSGSSTSTPGKLQQACEFNTCKSGSPAEGSNSTDPLINYVNGYPADSVAYGIKTLAPKLFGSAPDFVVAGFNVGSNLGLTVQFSGTVGAASQAALLGVPAVAFSAPITEQVSYTTLDAMKETSNTKAVLVYANLTTAFVDRLLNNTGPILPPGIVLNVNFPETSTKTCSSPSDFKWVLTRIFFSLSGKDVTTCGSNNLPAESTVAGGSGCYSSVSVFNASTKSDVDAATQKIVLDKLSGFLSCYTD